jgi:phosphate transport system permease protein
MSERVGIIRNSVKWTDRDNIRSEQIKGHIFLAFCIAAIVFGLLSLGTLLVYVFWDAAGWLDMQFLTSAPSRIAEQAGIFPMLAGSSFVISLVALLSLPLGVGAAVYLEEYAPDNLLKKLIEINISNLAGVPSIVYGLLGLGLFVSVLGLPYGTVLVGALTLTLRILPVVIVSSQEAIRAVPDSRRYAAIGMGMYKWQTIRTVVLPGAIPGIMTGMILALAGAMGETAPMIMIGAATSIFTPPRGLLSSFSAMPLQIFAWSDYPGKGFQHGVTPAAIVVLLFILLIMNGIAVYIRYRFSDKRQIGA